MIEYNNDKLTGSVGDFAALVGLTERRIQQLVGDKVVDTPVNGVYDLQSGVRKYCDFVRGVSRGSDTAKAEQIERTRLTRVKAATAELEYAEKKGSLIDAEASRRQGYALAVILKNNLQSIPDRVASIIAAESDATVVHELISTEVRNSLDNVVKSMEQTEVDDATLDITRRDALENLEKNDDGVFSGTSD